MIVILCRKDDNYANGIIEWLAYYNVIFLKIDLSEQKLSDFEIDVNEDDFQFKISTGKIIKYSEISYFFFRDGFIKYNTKNINFVKDKVLLKFLELENKTITDFVYKKIMQKCLGWINRERLNKLNQLSIAKKNGLSIPKSKVLNSKSSFIKSFEDKNVITKAIQENVNYQDENTIYTQRVQLITSKDLPQFFYSSMFQEKIDKIFEIRTFYLDGNFYSIGFINKIDDNLSVDMRDNYDNHIYFKFDLPEDIEYKLTNFMNTINLKSGSMDLIYGKDEKFYFLEINPEGQFEWVSAYGGYNLEKKIAKFLKQKYDNHKKNN